MSNIDSRQQQPNQTLTGLTAGFRKLANSIIDHAHVAAPEASVSLTGVSGDPTGSEPYRSKADKAPSIRISEDVCSVEQFSLLLKRRQVMHSGEFPTLRTAQLSAEKAQAVSIIASLGAALTRVAEPREAIYVQIGPFEVRPSVGNEIPIGRHFQPVRVAAVSRLAGYLGRDRQGLYVREVPEMPEYGLRPSRHGLWLKQPGDAAYRRLRPGEAQRITAESEVRLGGDGFDGQTGFLINIH